MNGEFFYIWSVAMNRTLIPPKTYEQIVTYIYETPLLTKVSYSS